MKLLKLETAIASCLRDIKPKNRINTPLDSACGHVIAENLSSHRDSPPSDLSAMDGYAFMHDTNFRENHTLSIIGKSPAGNTFETNVNQG